MKVLAVDGSPVTLAQIEHFVKQAFPHAEVVKLKNPKDALDYVAKHLKSISFVVADYSMEGMTGIELIDALLPHISAKKLALYTGNTGATIRTEMLRRGVHLITKGEIKEKLVSIIRSAALGGS